MITDFSQSSTTKPTALEHFECFVSEFTETVPFRYVAL
jgi:hypothetical protein